MLHAIVILGGWLLMMGQHDRSESLFYYFRLEDQISENHLLRLIDRHISLEFVRQQLKDSCSETGSARTSSASPPLRTPARHSHTTPTLN